MSLPEPINWLHMSEAEYIYLVSTGPPEKEVRKETERDFWQNFAEPSNRSLTAEMKQRFWNFNNWEFLDRKAITEPNDPIWMSYLFRKRK